VPRDRSRDRTARRRIDVAKAFRDAVDLDNLEMEFGFAAEESDTNPVTAVEQVDVLAPLDAIPSLVGRENIDWHQLDDLATKLLLQVDGAKSAMRIVTALAMLPLEAYRLIGSLACRGKARADQIDRPPKGSRRTSGRWFLPRVGISAHRWDCIRIEMFSRLTSPADRSEARRARPPRHGDLEHPPTAFHIG